MIFKYKIHKFLARLYYLLEQTANKPWRVSDELIELLHHQKMNAVDIKGLKYVSFAPNVGYRQYIYKYKGIYVSLYECEDCHDEYFLYTTNVSIKTVIVAKVLDIFKSSINWSYVYIK